MTIPLPTDGTRGQLLLARLRQNAATGAATPPPAETPVSAAQQTLLAAQALHDGHAVGTVTRSWALTGALDPAALERALQALAHRHDALRMSIAPGSGRPMARFAGRMQVSLPCEAVGGHESEQRLAQTAAAVARLSLEDLPPDGDRLWTARLFRIAPDLHVLAVAMHHLICDDWTWRILARDLFALYRAGPAAAPDLPDPGSFRSYLAQATAQSEVSVDPAWPEVDWPAARRDLADHEAVLGETVEAVLPPADFEALKAVARLHSCTPFTFFVSAYQLLLGRYCDQPALSVSISAADRFASGSQDCLGLLVRNIQVGLDLSDHTAFADVIRAMTRSMQSAQRDRSDPIHLGRAVIGYYNAPDLAADAGALAVQERPVPPRAVSGNLRLGLQPGAGGVRITFEGQRRYFDRRQLESLAATYRRILEQVIRTPDIPLADIALTFARQARAQADRSVRLAPSATCGDIPGRFAEVAARNPQATALATPDHSLTYAELDTATNALARWLLGQGLSTGDRLAVMAPRGGEVFRCWLAALKAGLVVVPVDPDLPAARVDHILRESGCAALAVPTGTPCEAHPAAARQLQLPGGPALAGVDRGPLPRPDAAAGREAFVMFTSGTTGRPKSIPVPHAGILRLATDVPHLPLQPGDRMIQLASSGFDGSFIEVWGAWLTGAALVLCEKPILADGGLAAELRRLRPTAAFMTTSLFNMIVDTEVAALRSLTHLSIGGEAASAAHCRAALAAHPQLKLFNVYGPTENCALTTAFRVTDPAAPTVPIGRPLPDNVTFVLSAALRPVPDGFAGELLIGGPGLARGYENRPDLSRERFVRLRARDLGLDHDGMITLYRSGDRVRWTDAGQLEFLGRRDSQFKLHGYRIEPSEIEGVLMGHPAVGRAAVLPDRGDGQGPTVGIVAYFDLVHGARASERDLRRFMATQLPRPVQPTRYVRVDAIPLTANGKADVQALERAAAPVSPEAGAAPSGEDPLTEIWRRTLKRGSIPEDQDFYALGGTSLSLVRMILEVEETFGVQIDFSALAGEPTLRRLRFMISLSPARTETGLRHLRVLRAGNPQLAPIVILPLNEGSAAWSIEIIGRLGARNPLYAMTFDFPDTPALEERHFAGLLRSMLDDLVALDASAPPILVGFSFGGILGAHIAAQAARQSVPVGMVITIDGTSPAIWIAPEDRHGGTAYARFMRQFRLHPVGPIEAECHVITAQRRFPFCGPDCADMWSLLTVGPVRDYPFDTHHGLLINSETTDDVTRCLERIVDGSAIAARQVPGRLDPRLLDMVNRAKRLALAGDTEGVIATLEAWVPDPAQLPAWLFAELIGLYRRTGRHERLAKLRRNPPAHNACPQVWQELAVGAGHKRAAFLARCMDASGPVLSGALPLVELLVRKGRIGRAGKVIDTLAASPRHAVETGLARSLVAAVAGDAGGAFALVSSSLSDAQASVAHFNWAVRFLTQHHSAEHALEVVGIGRSRFPSQMEAHRRNLRRKLGTL
ncbi:non-ribosomal peptide synthetase [Halovulum marinum]|uniref:non-ribosomal peptide synthetase n=1 Tax=Halovulum marinum TaxID=2662447 RepID=UPI001F44D9EB|nr:non-ribosomal peptide synthetase [Halovulum marinum]